MNAINSLVLPFCIRKDDVMALTNQQVLEKILERDLHVYKNLSMLMDMCLGIKEEDEDKVYTPTIIKNAKLVKMISSQESRNDIRFMDLYWKALHTLAPYDFDSFLLYMERERPAKNRFYLPRREQLLKIGAIQLFQDMEDDLLDVGGLSVVPGAGKTTLEEFFMPWVIGRHIDDYNIFASHSGGICRMFYDAVDALTSSPEYKYVEIFPEVKRYSSNAKEMQLNFGKYKPFKSLSCVSVASIYS